MLPREQQKQYWGVENPAHKERDYNSYSIDLEQFGFFKAQLQEKNDVHVPAGWNSAQCIIIIRSTCIVGPGLR